MSRRGLKRHAVPTAKLQRLSRRDVCNDVGNLPHVDRRRISPAEPQLQSDIRSMPLARLGQASQQLHPEVSDRCQQALRLQVRDESSGRAPRTQRMRAGRPDPDLEHLEHAH